MLKRLKSYAILLITLLTLCGFAAPLFCESAHAHVDLSSQIDHQASQKSDMSSKHQKPGKMAMHDCCCLGHHCCSAKLVSPIEFGLLELRLDDSVQTVYADQHVTSFHLGSLDRPPKHLA
jgi:hypothetical protein